MKYITGFALNKRKIQKNVPPYGWIACLAFSPCSRHPPELAPADDEIGDGDDCPGDGPGDGVDGHEHVDIMPFAKGCGDPDQADAAAAQSCQYGRRQGMAHAPQAAAADLVDPRHQFKHSHEKDADIGIFHDGRIFRKYQDQTVPAQGKYAAQKSRGRQPFQRAELIDSGAAVSPACRKILTGEGDCCLAESIYHKISHIFKILPGCISGYAVRSETVYRRLDDDIGKGKYDALKTCRHSDLQDLCDKRPAQAELPPGEMKLVRLSRQEIKSHESIYPHGRNRCDGDSRHSHVEDDDKEQVSEDIDQAGKGKADQGMGAVALAPEYGRAEVVDHEKRHAQKIDPQIEPGHMEDITRSPHEGQQPGRDHFPRRQQKEAADEGHGKDCVDSLRDPPSVPLADQRCDQNIRPDGKTDKKADQKIDQRGIAAHRRHGIAGIEFPDDRQIGRRKKLLQNACRRHGKGKKDQLVPERTMQHINFFLHQASHLQQTDITVFLQPSYCIPKKGSCH